MPNTEVKPSYTDNTWLETAREDRQLPDPKEVSDQLSLASFLHIQHLHSIALIPSAECLESDNIQQGQGLYDALNKLTTAKYGYMIE